MKNSLSFFSLSFSLFFHYSFHIYIFIKSLSSNSLIILLSFIVSIILFIFFLISFSIILIFLIIFIYPQPIHILSTKLSTLSTSKYFSIFYILNWQFSDYVLIYLYIIYMLINNINVNHTPTSSAHRRGYTWT